MHTARNPSKELIIITIDLGHTKDDIHIRSSDTPVSLSKNFCKKHNLDTKTESSISDYISLNLSKLSLTPKHIKSLTPQNIPEMIPEAIQKTSRIKRKSPLKSFYQSNSPEKQETISAKKQPKVYLPGERLYYKSIIDIKSKKETISKLLAEKESKELTEATFKPATNHKSISRMRNKDEIFLKDKKVKEKIETQRLIKAQQEMKDCTFHPSVNRTSSKIDRIKTKDRGSYLYEYSKKKQSNIKET